jgi:flavin reductase (DIM6/NTAB) family NADH-FMN oxidoreductase RutF
MMTIDPQLFRRVLGHYPTGVCAVTSAGGERPVALIVGTFSSVSLDPPLVGFFPVKTSRSWAAIRAAERFCVNVLAAGQQTLCDTIFRGGGDVLDELPHHPSPAGHPRFDGALAWIDCALWAVHDGGDHDIVLGAVQALGEGAPGEPLLFFRGGYGNFAAFDQRTR